MMRFIKSRREVLFAEIATSRVTVRDKRGRVLASLPHKMGADEYFALKEGRVLHGPTGLACNPSPRWTALPDPGAAAADRWPHRLNELDVNMSNSNWRPPLQRLNRRRLPVRPLSDRRRVSRV